MKAIQQLYCTHCTGATNALFVAGGAGSAREAAGYSARAGSAEGGELRNLYREVEPFLSYALPPDTPNDERGVMTASSPHAPKRLISTKSSNGSNIVGQICYRQKATDGRPQSYFGHILTWPAESADRLQQARSALQLWGAKGWVLEDSTELDKHLAPLESPMDLLVGQRPAVNDDLVVDFLTVTADGAFRDPAGVLPARWRHQTAKQRQDVFKALLQGFLETGVNARTPVVLVAEPSVAALLFYAILRVLPKGGFASDVTVSTYETNVRRSDASMAATVFADPKTDLPRETYAAGRGWAMNTFPEAGGSRTPSRGTPSKFAELVISLLLAPGAGWPELDAFLEDLVQAGATTLKQLEELAAARAALAEIRQTGKLQTATVDRESTLVQKYLHSALTREILAGDAGQTIEQSRLLELLGLGLLVPPDAGPAELVAWLANSEHVGAIVRAPNIGVPWKALIVGEAIKATGSIPIECGDLWQAGNGPLTLKAIVPHLNSKAIAGLHEQAPDKPARLDLIVACAQAGKYTGEGRLLDKMAEQAITKIKPDILFARLAKSDALSALGKGAAPSLERWLHLQVAAVVRGVIESRESWSDGYRLLRPVMQLMRDQDSRCLLAWAGCQEEIAKLAQTPPQTITFDKTCHALVDHFKTALGLSHQMLPDLSDPEQLFKDFMKTWGGKWDKLPLPQKTKVEPYLNGEPWQESSAIDFRKLAADKRVLAAAGLVLVAVIGLAITWGMSGREKRPAEKKDDGPKNIAETKPNPKPADVAVAPPAGITPELKNPSTETVVPKPPDKGEEKPKGTATAALPNNPAPVNENQKLTAWRAEFDRSKSKLKALNGSPEKEEALQKKLQDLKDDFAKLQIIQIDARHKKPSRDRKNAKITAVLGLRHDMTLTFSLRGIQKSTPLDNKVPAPKSTLTTDLAQNKSLEIDLTKNAEQIPWSFYLDIICKPLGLEFSVPLPKERKLDSDYEITFMSPDGAKQQIEKFDDGLKDYLKQIQGHSSDEWKSVLKDGADLVNKGRKLILDEIANHPEHIRLKPQAKPEGSPSGKEYSIIFYDPALPMGTDGIKLPNNFRILYDLKLENVDNHQTDYAFHLTKDQTSTTRWKDVVKSWDPAKEDWNNPRGYAFIQKTYESKNVLVIPFLEIDENAFPALGTVDGANIENLEKGRNYRLTFEVVDQELRKLLTELADLDSFERQINSHKEMPKGS